MNDFIISELFTVDSGKIHAAKELGDGIFPLISCGDTTNGLVGFFDIPEELLHKNSITVAYNGSWPLLSKFHPYEFGAKDDVAVLVPKFDLPESVLVYVAALFNRSTWRYSYGRKCFREKVRNQRLRLPIADIAELQSKENAITKFVSKATRDYLPKLNISSKIKSQSLTWKNEQLVKFFHLKRGDFHSLSVLGAGNVPTIARGFEDNGIAGNFEMPDDAELYAEGSLTISTVGGDAFVQLEKFIATDNVIVCRPIIPMDTPTLFFFSYLLNRQKWRYSYGRQCYMNKITKLELPVPITGKGELNQNAIRTLVSRSPYWDIVNGKLINVS
jgi:hypothetical protein